MTGPLPNFAAMLSSPMYEPLLGHTLAEMHLVAQRGSDKATVVVRKSCLCHILCHKLPFASQLCSLNHPALPLADVMPSPQLQQLGYSNKLVYLWVLSLQESQTSCANCWTTDRVQFLKPL